MTIHGRPYKYTTTNGLNIYQAIVATNNVSTIAIYLYNQVAWAIVQDTPQKFPSRAGFSSVCSLSFSLDTH